MMFRLFTLILCLALVTVAPGAVAQVPTEPQLRIEAGMHTAMIKRIATDAAGRVAVTASDDKSVRVWDMASGDLLRVLRPPIGPGDEGKLFAVALSADGALVAAGGWTKLGSQTGNTIYLFDRASGRLRQRLTGLPNVVQDLAFSPDGRHLAVGIGGSNGIRVWRMGGTWAQVLADTEYGGKALGLSWAADGRLAATSNDGDIRLYGPDLVRRWRVKAKGGERPAGIAFSPDGTKLAVGYDDKLVVEVLSAADGALSFRPDLTGINNGNLVSVAWWGGDLVAGGSWDVGGDNPVRRWSAGGRGAYRDLPLSSTSIMDLALLPDGGLLAAAGDPAWGRLEPSGKKRPWKTSPSIDMRDKLGDAFTVAADGSRVRFGQEIGGGKPLLLDLSARALSPAGTGTGLTPARTEAPGLTVAGWVNDDNPTLNAKPLALQQYETARSLAMLPDAKGFVLGADWSLRLFDQTGQQRAERSAPGTAWGVNATSDGRLLVAAYGDGTIRWHRASDLVEVLAAFVHVDGRRWVAWTPSGYYMAGPGGEELIGWHVNNGMDQAADFYPAGRFRERFNRPDVVEAVLRTLDEAEALRQANAAAGRQAAPVAAASDLRASLPPIAEFVSPASGGSFAQPIVTVRYRVRSPSGKPVTGVRLLVDGRPVGPTRGLGAVQATDQEFSLPVTLPTRDVTLSLVAESADGAGPVASVALRWTGRPAVDPTLPTLYVLAVGTSAYDKPELKLGYAAKDASDIGKALKAQEGGLYARVEVKVLADVDKDAVLDGLDWLVKNVTSRDVAIIFMAGHGMTDLRGDYWYLPRNADPDSLRRTALPKREISDALERLSGKVLMFMDTCHAAAVGTGRQTRGTVDLSKLIAELADADGGVVMFSSSSGKELSVEDSRWANGAFTEALLEGLSGKAEVDGTPGITLSELDLWLTKRVKELTDGQQHPVMQRPDAIPNIPVALPR
ncbi:caspase family protein [Niveispirillum sp.]|uniref:caspase family protein n=1 Tax=Niveispirillum sp. TaxID=1917217 RepID=UPI001B5A78F2|nr:caspase family protein [Niveispirillum sp.]MBP7335879.1 caspase family protein [Niveispirillum sp.]